MKSRRPSISRVGDTYGKMLVLSVYRKDEQSWAACQCKCGNKKDIRLTSLVSGFIKSCGCTQHDRSAFRVHGLMNHPLHWVWGHMKARCLNPNNDGYKNYGGRGIKVCSEWADSFKSFYDWCISNGYARGLEIDRINVNGNYTPENCRFVTDMVQAYNRRNTIYIEYKGERKNLKEWAEKLNCPTNVIKLRYHRGWDVERILTQKILQR